MIPALAERDSLFRTLAGIARNPSGDLQKTLVICVVNNHRPPLASDEEIRDNQKTLAYPAVPRFRKSRRSGPLRRDAGRSSSRSPVAICGLAFIDASSPGMEIPDRDGGVGTARKIGMDAALRIRRCTGGGRRGDLLSRCRHAGGGELPFRLSDPFCQDGRSRCRLGLCPSEARRSGAAGGDLLL